LPFGPPAGRIGNGTGHDFGQARATLERLLPNAVAAVQATLSPLTLAAVTNQQCQVTIQPTVPSLQYVRQSSPDLSAWSALLTNTATTNLLELVDPHPADQSRCHRVLIQ
jgi:hypothetical protein